jgi:hypothetical protein
VEAPNIDKKPNEEKLRKILSIAKDIKERNRFIIEPLADSQKQPTI